MNRSQSGALLGKCLTCQEGSRFLSLVIICPGWGVGDPAHFVNKTVLHLGLRGLQSCEGSRTEVNVGPHTRLG